jgi:hypothetical protein
MYAVLLFSQDWIPAIISGFMQAGLAADIEGINPGEVFMQGLGLAGTMLKSLVDASLLFQPAAVLTGLFAAFLLFFAFCAISYQLALTLMESYIVTGGGVFLLGFGAFHGTVNITEKYLSYVIGVGIKLFVLCLIIGAGKQLAPMWGALAKDADLMSIVSTPLAIAGGAMLYGTAAWMLPSLAAAWLVEQWVGIQSDRHDHDGLAWRCSRWRHPRLGPERRRQSVLRAGARNNGVVLAVPSSWEQASAPSRRRGMPPYRHLAGQCKTSNSNGPIWAGAVETRGMGTREAVKEGPNHEDSHQASSPPQPAGHDDRTLPTWRLPRRAARAPV